MLAMINPSTVEDKLTRYDIIRASEKIDRCLGEKHSSSHQCATLVRYCCEFAARFHKEVCIISCDDKCKVHCGCNPCIDRRTKSHKTYAENCVPDHRDHDKRTGCTFTLCGYMILEKKMISFVIHIYILK